ncbi:MAG TPA: helix-turn-helix domain-containing protein [Casimicrobiaceae bacterium]|jgi:cytoskeleton protein RodZ|nr:helix-turn-helix domain-containing protein [Casimicrobiaceae bacterium]
MDLEAQPADGSVPEPDAYVGAGAQLRAAREAAGLSLDQVAQQLKLAPRQVRALEDEDFGMLPGRTFTRGFMRNYARLLNLDPDLLVAHLPDAAHAPSLEPPPLHSTGTTMAELPTAHARTPTIGRWLIPLVLAAAIVAAAGYEWYRGRPAKVAAPPRATQTAPAPNAPNMSTTPLPNPVAPDSSAPAATAPATSGGLAPPGPQPERPPQSTAPAAATATNAAVDAVLVIRYEGPSWTEIRDSAGQTLISRLVDADSIEPFDGAPPFSIVIGNARAVTLLYRGQPVDLVPYTRLNVARLILR